MGVASSIAEERRLFEEVTSVLEPAPMDKEKKDDDENDESDQEKNKELPQGREESLIDKVSSIYKRWYYQQIIHHDVTFCKLINIPEQIERAFQSGRTPLILDSSPDEKVATYYSYQLDAILLHANIFLTPINKKKPSAQAAPPLEVNHCTNFILLHCIILVIVLYRLQEGPW